MTPHAAPESLHSSPPPVPQPETAGLSVANVGSEPDRVVAYLRSVINTPEPEQAAPEGRILGIFRRKRPSPLGVLPTLAPKRPAEPEANPEPAALESAASAPELAPPPIIEEPEPAAPAQAAAEPPAPEPVVAEQLSDSIRTILEQEPTPEALLAEELRYEPAADFESAQISEVQAEPELIAEEPIAAEPAEPSVTAEPETPEVAACESEAPAPFVEAAPEPVPEAIPEAAPEPIAEAAAEVIPEPIPEPILEAAPEPAPRPTAMRGEVLPPEAFAAGSTDRRRPAEPARVITMQPGTRHTSGGTPPTQAS